MVRPIPNVTRPPPARLPVAHKDLYIASAATMAIVSYTIKITKAPPSSSTNRKKPGPIPTAHGKEASRRGITTPVVDTGGKEERHAETQQQVQRTPQSGSRSLRPRQSVRRRPERGAYAKQGEDPTPESPLPRGGDAKSNELYQGDETDKRHRGVGGRRRQLCGRSAQSHRSPKRRRHSARNRPDIRATLAGKTATPPTRYRRKTSLLVPDPLKPKPR